MKVRSIKPIGHKPVYDISIETDDYDKQQYVLENGVVTHNTGIYYSASNIWIIGRQQEKTGTEISGYDFIINVEKSRYVKEKSKIPISVSWDGGIEKYSGLLDIAVEGGYVAKPSQGWYCKVDRETGELMQPKVREKDTMNKEFWDSIFQSTDFSKFIEKKYCIGVREMMSDKG
jgi:hypothetical protein